MNTRRIVVMVFLLVGATLFPSEARAEREVIRFGVTTVLAEHAVEATSRLVNYIEGRVGSPIKIIQKNSFQAINDMMKRREIDMAIVCGTAYVQGHRQFGMQLLVSPQPDAEGPFYYSYLIVPADSPVRSLAQLEGQRFAFADPLSLTGRLIPVREVFRLGKRPETFFKVHLYTHSHSGSVEAVADKLVDGASVESYIWEFLRSTNPELTARTKVIQKFGPYGMTHIVVSPGLDPRLMQKLQHAFLKMDGDDLGAAILEGLRLQKFVVVEDSHYDSIRAVQRMVHRAYLGRALPVKAQ